MTDEDLHSSSTVYEYANHVCEIGDFIQPALASWIVSGVSEYTGSNFNKPRIYAWDEDTWLKTLDWGSESHEPPIIFDLDLDYFAPEMNFISKQDRINFVRKQWGKASYATICTSPYFIDQGEALNILHEIFSSITQ